MHRIVAQGDLLIERVADVVPPLAQRLEPGSDGAVVLAEGETTGHRHAIYDRVTMFRDEALARDIPDGLYVGHVQVTARDGANVVHEEHSPLHLTEGTYRVRRQREMQPQDVQLVRD